MSIFKSKGFDTIISKNTMLVGELCFSGSVVVDGEIKGLSVKQNTVEPKPSSLHVNGSVDVEDVIIIDDLTITGRVTAREVRVEGTLAIKSGCVLKADRILYRNLVAEPGAIILGTLAHLDRVSDGEQV